MADITNTTGSAGLGPSMQMYYDKKLIKDMKPKLVHCNYGQKRPIPRNAGKTVKFRKYTPFEAATTPLTEGVTPDGHAITQTEISATVAQYGDYVRVTDLLDMTAVDPVISDSVELNADQAALTLDTVVREVMCAGTNVMYANGTSRADVAAGNILTTTLIRKAVRTLKKAKARPFYRNGKPYFYAIVGPDTVFDLQSDENWLKVSQYQQAEKIENGEIGKLFGIVFIETTESKIFATAGAGTPKADVACTLMFGADAYGLIDIAGSGAAKTIVKTFQSGGTEDPLEQRSTIAWKVPAFCAKILQQTWMLRIEHGISA